MSRISSNGALALREESIPDTGRKPLVTKPAKPRKPKKSRTKPKPTKVTSQDVDSIIESTGSIPFDKVSLDTSLRIKLCVVVDGDETSDGPRYRNIGPDFRDTKRHRELLEILYHELDRRYPGRVRIIIE